MEKQLVNVIPNLIGNLENEKYV